MTQEGKERQAKVLFVDDEENILRAIKRLFLDEPVDILTASSGQEGLDVLSREQEVSLVVSDQRMPGMTGVEFLEQAREIVPDAPRIILTGYADIEASIDAINKGGAYRYLAKPWNDDDLIQTVREALSRYDLIRENKRLEALVRKHNEELKDWNAKLAYYIQEQTLDIQKKNQELEELAERLRKSFSNTISAFSGVLELRDSASRNHSKNVAAVSVKVARDMGLPEGEIDTLTVASLLHDIGKVASSDLLLSKDYGEMNQDEKMEYMLHPVRGQAAIDAVEDLRAAGIIIRHHHEWYNGAGFPDRLMGRKIPIGSRIIAIADFFDRTFSRFQGSNAVDTVWEMVKQEAGRRFDPDICETFEKALKETYATMTPKTDLVEREFAINDLMPGMVISRNVLTGSGLLLLKKGTELNESNIQAINRYDQIDPMTDGVFVLVKG